ncbi:hypothetical protein GQ42DRAFT_120639 [Ramicandelaber brevisporus]|nr:hypothetical protein GQ42DRAFT_120639 [Ramicandelaber brevisporus]
MIQPLERGFIATVGDSTTNTATTGTTTNATAAAATTIAAGVPAGSSSAVDDVPIFSIDRVQFTLPARIVAAEVANRVLVLVLESNLIMRIDLQTAHSVDEIMLPRRPSENLITPRRIFLDPSARHLLIVTTQLETYYLHSSWSKPKALAKFKGLDITSVAWNKAVSSISTRAILLGTSDGGIYETEIEPSDEYFKRDDKYLVKLFAATSSDHSSRSANSITGIYFESFPANPRSYFIIATTQSRIYQFVGSKYNASSGNTGMYQEMPTSGSTTSNVHRQLRFFSKNRDRHQLGTATSFAWLTEPGVFHGQLVYGSKSLSDGGVITNASLVPYPAPPQSASPNSDLIAIALSEYHSVLLYRDRVRAVCLLNDEVVYEDMIMLDSGESAISLSIDALGGYTYWIFTPSSIYELIVDREDRDMWKIYLQKKMFDQALAHSSTPSQKDAVVVAQADYNYSQGRYLLSAKYYAQSTSLPFEEIALKYMVQRNEPEALKEFLLQRLDQVKKKHHLAQAMVLATWITELSLNQLNQSEDAMASLGALLLNSNSSTNSDLMVDEFRSFMEANKHILDQSTTYQVIGAHARTDDMLFAAALFHDYDLIVRHWLDEGDYQRALSSLLNATSSENSSLSEMFYRYTPQLLKYLPAQTIDALIRQPDVSPRKLLPALATVNANDSIRYLTHVIRARRMTDQVVHNFLVSVLASAPTLDESTLVRYLTEYSALSSSANSGYSAGHALRVCRASNRVKSCVLLYSMLGQSEDAVDLALESGDIELAQIHADRPRNTSNTDELRRRLWLKIARHVIDRSASSPDGIKSVIAFLRRCDPLLTIEDILPLLHDFSSIDDFKDEICQALEAYSDQIRVLRAEMDDATRNAESISREISSLKTRFALLGRHDSCQLCGNALAASSSNDTSGPNGNGFLVFPCQHVFHSDCVLDKAAMFLTATQRRRVKQIQQQISLNVASNGSGDVIEKLKSELNAILTTECILCGDAIIRTIDEPFVGIGENEAFVYEDATSPKWNASF